MTRSRRRRYAGGQNGSRQARTGSRTRTTPIDLYLAASMSVARPKPSRLWYLRRSVWRDARNLTRYGLQAPRWSQLIWVDPLSCTSFTSSYNRGYTGQVVGGDWDIETLPLVEEPKIRACREHWVDGLSWEATGIIDVIVAEIERRGSKDGCRSLDDVVERYRRLDAMFEKVGHENRLKRRQEIDPNSFRERGGVYFHIGRDNTPVFGGGGCHRLAMAQILELPAIPGQLGVVHEHSLATWKGLFQTEPAKR